MIRNLVVLFAIFLILTAAAVAQGRIYVMQPKGSSITYTIVHPLHTFSAVSKSAEGRLEVDSVKREITAVEAAVDVTTFDSGNSNRDSHAMEAVDALTYPEVRFSSTSVVQHSDSIRATGSLLFHGQSKEIVMAGRVETTGVQLHVQGHFAISMKSFGIDPPSLLLMPVQDTVRFSLDAVFEPLVGGAGHAGTLNGGQ